MNLRQSDTDRELLPHSNGKTPKISTYLDGGLKSLQVFLRLTGFDQDPCSPFGEEGNSSQILGGQIVPYYQLIHDDLRNPCASEVLMRLVHGGSVLRPDQFLPSIVSLGQSFRYDMELYQLVSSHISYLQRICNDGTIHLNVSVQTLSDPSFANAFLDLVGDHPSICLEITEFDSYQIPIAIIRENIKTICSKGDLSLSIDDVGKGNSLLRFLLSLGLGKLKSLKLDREIYANRINDPITHKRISHLLKIARILGLQIIVEGVETEEQLQVLQRLGVSYFQGYLFHRPSELIIK